MTPHARRMEPAARPAAREPVARRTTPDTRPTDIRRTIAGLLSAVIPGVGQAFNRRYRLARWLIVLTATLSTQLNALGSAIRKIRQEAPQCRVLVGGPAFGETPEIWRRLGADAFGADLESVVATADGLITAR